MNLILANRDLATTPVLDVLFQLLKMSDAVVGDTNGADLACLLGLDESTPGTQASFSATVGGVDQNAVLISQFWITSPYVGDE